LDKNAVDNVDIVLQGRSIYININKYINCFILECNLGYYGYKCNISCDGCLSDSCDSEYGICADTSGCKPGWQPRQPKCDLGILMEK
jgi:hypothetical protein